jgi:hypothetical protein
VTAGLRLGGGPAETRVAAVLAGLCLATAAYSVLQSLVVPALGVFQRELGTTPSGAAWILTGFLLSASVSTPCWAGSPICTASAASCSARSPR